MTYTIQYSDRANKALVKIPMNWRRRIMDKVSALAVDPYAVNNNVTRLKGEISYRLRIGDWRVIYKLDDGNLLLLVVNLGPRGDVYD